MAWVITYEEPIVALVSLTERSIAEPLRFVADNGYDTAAQQIEPIGVVSVG